VLTIKKPVLVLLACALALGSPGTFRPVLAADNFRMRSATDDDYSQGISGGAAATSRTGPAQGPPSAGGFYQPPVGTPYYPTNVYAPNYDPYGGYLQGGADIIRAQGDLQIQLQQAKITKEQAEQAKLDTRRKAFDQSLYERKRRPTAEDDREKARIERMRRARNDPPLHEITSGYSLNTLLDSINKMHQQGISGPTVPLDPYLLTKINVTNGAGQGNVGALRNGGKLQWPLKLRTSAYASERKRLDKLAADAYKQAAQGMVEADTVVEMQNGVNRLLGQLKSNIKQIPFSDYVTMKRYLNELNKSITALENDPNVGKYVSGQWSARGDTVSELVRNMISQGLRFAQATHGNENAYTALHSAMVEYYTRQGGPYQRWDTATK
jgi:hypothetical protein